MATTLLIYRVLPFAKISVKLAKKLCMNWQDVAKARANLGNEAFVNLGTQK